VNRRFFTTRQRAELFIAAEGHCQKCGCELESGWNGDHVIPHSKGGPTKTTNGQALCPDCNRKKGSKLQDPRDELQANGIRTYLELDKENFLAALCPGAGKTKLALLIARELFRRNVIDLVVVVTPSDELRDQWHRDYDEVDLRPYNPRDVFVRKNGYHGIVTTYQSLGENSRTAGVLRETVNSRTLVILDEPHHAAIGTAFGDGIIYAFENAGRRLLLSGTPWRTKKHEQIPFMEYDDGGKPVYDIAFSYGDAVARGVCRPTHFPVLKGYVSYAVDGEVSEFVMSPDEELPDEDVSDAMRALLNPPTGWVREAFAAAYSDLMGIRETVPDAGMLIVARDRWHAEEIRQMVQRETGFNPRVVMSAEDGGSATARDDIAAFRPSDEDELKRRGITAAGHEPVVIAVKMIAEGVDIKRLAVGVYATNIQSRMFFAQVIGRVVRKRSSQDHTVARFYIPPTKVLAGLASEIEQMQRAALEDQGPVGPGPGGPKVSRDFIALASEALGLDRVIASGGMIEADQINHWEDILRAANVPTVYASQLAAESENPPAAPAEPKQKRYAVEQKLRSDLNVMAAKVAHHVLGDRNQVKEVNAALWESWKKPRAQLSIAELEAQLSYLKQWLADGRRP
jgi:superfamily II DNA or RNA helicase